MSQESSTGGLSVADAKEVMLALVSVAEHGQPIDGLAAKLIAEMMVIKASIRHPVRAGLTADDYDSLGMLKVRA